ncbi:CheR family methyltransferase [Methylomarinum vadi]|uniref:CheR family methyltransferase n=1 Tax=Methylomarinum vadi TaxID=438855 RepID=UPI0004DF515E|nr:protein-glutamate O-methyltransferase CheR [Methylomarinum vadi]
MLAKTSQTNKKAVVSGADYQAIRDFLNRSSGIVLGENKQYLVQNRLSPLLKKFDLASFADLVSALQSPLGAARQIRSAVIDAMTTNETFWFRDNMQFTVLSQSVLPELLNQKTGTIKIWSAACSTGQEPYSISMCAEDVVRSVGRGRNIQIIGTDISESVLLEAQNAVYSELALSRGIEPMDRQRFFLKMHEGYRVKPEINQRVRFQQFNLLKPFSVLGRFDVIFCRNVLIYFSDDVKRDILRRMAGALEPGGYLFLSTTESMPVGLKEFEPVKGGVRYFKKVG